MNYLPSSSERFTGDPAVFNCRVRQALGVQVAHFRMSHDTYISDYHKVLPLGCILYDLRSLSASVSRQQYCSS